MADLVIRKKNEVFLRVDCDPHIRHELQDQFTFDVPGAKFMPQYRNKYWDGKIRLFNMDRGEIYCGLIDKLQVFCERYAYTFEFEENKLKHISHRWYSETGEISEEEVLFFNVNC